MANNQFNLSFVADLDRGITLTPLRQAFLQDDHQAHVFTIKTKNGGAENTLTGATVTGYFIPQGANTAVQLTGNVNTDGTATVALTRDCYAFVGRFHLVIQATIGSVVSSIFYGEGYVARTRTDKVIEPSDAAPSLGALEQMINNLTYADVGAAPAGYGLGGVTKPLYSTDDINNIKTGGRYTWGSSVPANAPLSFCMMDVLTRNDSTVIQVIYTISDAAGKRCTLMRHSLNADAWDEFEYENPPMLLGVEYRTTKRYNGKVVYTKLTNAGQMPNTTSKYLDGVVVDGCTGFVTQSLRLVSPGNPPNDISSHPNLSVKVYYDGTYGWVIFETSSDLSALTCYITLEYTKD